MQKILRVCVRARDQKKSRVRACVRKYAKLFATRTAHNICKIVYARTITANKMQKILRTRTHAHATRKKSRACVYVRV